MGRVLYGVMGDQSRGHLSRSLAIARQLDMHEIVFVGGGRVQELARQGFSVIPAPVLETIYRDRRVDAAGTIVAVMSAFAQRSGVIARLTAAIEDFDPDLIITDYEYFLPLAARRAGRPCFSVDRQHALTHCRYRPPAGQWLSRVLTVGGIRTLSNAASRYFVCSFVPMQPIDPNLTEVFAPVLRPEVAGIAPSCGEHVTVYLLGARLDWVREHLAHRPRRFVIYGFDIEHTEGNLVFRRSSDAQFLRDLASSAYVIGTGGHNLISEALHYRKPILCFPIRLAYEQFLNAHLLAEAGYGAYHMHDEGAGAAIDAFEAGLPQYHERVASYAVWDHNGLVSRLQTLIAHRGAMSGERIQPRIENSEMRCREEPL